MIPLLDLKRQYATIEPQINQAVKEVFEKQTFILGSEVEAFENDITEKFQTGHAIGVSSGTDALLLSLIAWEPFRFSWISKKAPLI